jgi:hypothetical protein
MDEIAMCIQYMDFAEMMTGRMIRGIRGWINLPRRTRFNVDLDKTGLETLTKALDEKLDRKDG